MNILLTGATGFIGSHLAEALVSGSQDTLRCLVLKQDNILGESVAREREELLRKKGGNLRIIYGDLLDKGSLVKATEGIDKVFHLGGIGKPMNVPKEAYYDTNVTGTKNLLEACSRNEVKKIIHVSSMSVFGYSRDRQPLTENSPFLPVSDYGKSKLEGEKAVLEFTKQNKIESIVMRPPMVFGPRDFQFLKLFRMINTGFFPLMKGGRAKIEFCYVGNIVNSILAADERGQDQSAYNISDGETYIFGDICREIARAEGVSLFPLSPPVAFVKMMGKVTEIVCGAINIHPPFNSGTPDWMTNDNPIDISKAEKELGYKREYDIKESINETIQWYKRKGYL